MPKQKLVIFLFLLSALILIGLIFFFLNQKKIFGPKLSVNVLSRISGSGSNNIISPPLINQIFNSDHAWTSTLSAQKRIVLTATGDIIPARSVNAQVIKHGDYKWPYLNIAEITRNSDLTFINLESPLINNCPVTDEGMIFCGDAKNVEGLVFIGADIASLANNHAGNYGAEAVQNTIDLLNKNGILTTGTDGPVFKEIKGMKFAFLGYNDIEKNQTGISNADEEKIKREIADAKKEADIIVVTFHWGAEYRELPDERQKFLGYLAIDAGADLIIGNHPHWVQPVEIYKDKIITYAHGNFIFDQMWSEETKTGVVGRYTFYGKKLIDVEFLPVYIENYGQPRILGGEQKAGVLERMKINSLRLMQKN